MTYIMGIDEAGRGPVLGPMVYGACFCTKQYAQQHLPQLGFADSKVLNAAQREHLFQIIQDEPQIHFLKTVLMPESLSADMLRK
jgi:ribonuclease H2 subunit A